MEQASQRLRRSVIPKRNKFEKSFTKAQEKCKSVKDEQQKGVSCIRAQNRKGENYEG